MRKLTIKYLGLTLKSPVIIGSSRLTSSIDNLKLAEENGAGAVILKSLFEEQISNHIKGLNNSTDYPEADDYIANYTRSHSVDEYLDLISSAKKELKIPVIPSINCYSVEGWTDFARKIEDRGADALEMNLFFMPLDRKKTSVDCEKVYLDLIEKIKSTIKIPVSIKLGLRFSNILYLADQLYMRDVNGVVLFNRFYEPDIDIVKMQITNAPVLSTQEEMRYVLRSVAMLSGQDMKIDISASTGVNSGNDAIKYILAGANSVQVCSVLYRKGIPFIKTINQQIVEWMDMNKFEDINEFRGKLNLKNWKQPTIFERAQFMKYFSSID
jgi:dihydroorotate dehydrogenase (fumarate)